MDIFGYRNSDVSRYICRARDRLVRMTISNRILSVRNSSGESLHVLEFRPNSDHQPGNSHAEPDLEGDSRKIKYGMK
mgnify:CR=1 FL=1